MRLCIICYSGKTTICLCNRIGVCASLRILNIAKRGCLTGRCRILLQAAAGHRNGSNVIILLIFCTYSGKRELKAVSVLPSTSGEVLRNLKVFFDMLHIRIGHFCRLHAAAPYRDLNTCSAYAPCVSFGICIFFFDNIFATN